MRIITENVAPSTIKLTDIQSAILTKIVAAATPQTAAEEISAGENMVAARDILQKLGVIAISGSAATLTKVGQELMQNRDLLTPTGELTERGKQFAQIKNLNDLSDIDDTSQSGKSKTDLQLENLTLIRSIHEQIKIEESLKKLQS